MVKPAARLSAVVGDVAANYDGRVVVAPTGQAVDVAVGREGAGDRLQRVEREFSADDPVQRHRWRVIAVDTEHHRISPPAAWAIYAHAPPSAATTWHNEHITHGYAITVHASCVPHLLTHSEG